MSEQSQSVSLYEGRAVVSPSSLSTIAAEVDQFENAVAAR